MLSESSWTRGKQTCSAFWFTVRYWLHTFLLQFRYRLQKVIHTLRLQIESLIREYWYKMQPLTEPPVDLTDPRQPISDRLQAWANPVTTMATLHMGWSEVEQCACQETAPFAVQDEQPTLAMQWLTAPRTRSGPLSIDQIPTLHTGFERSRRALFQGRKRDGYKSMIVKLVPLLTLSVVALFLLSGLIQGSPAHQVLRDVKALTLAAAPFSALDLDTAQQRQGNGNASQALVRISQLDPAQYNSQADFDTWAYSTCSTAAMTEVFNAYGRHYRIADVLKVQSAIGEITPQQGLLENIGVARTAAQFGFQTNWGNSWNIDQVINSANAGYPVIVGWPPSLYPEGHIVVVTGGDASVVHLADSSLWNRQVISRDQFLQWWGGFAAVVTPA
jgi:hypothetical protein